MEGYSVRLEIGGTALRILEEVLGFVALVALVSSLAEFVIVLPFRAGFGRRSLPMMEAPVGQCSYHFVVLASAVGVSVV